MSDFTSMIGYAQGVVAVAILAGLLRHKDAMRALGVVTLSWLAWSAAIIIFWRSDPWMFGIVSDAVAAAFLIFSRPSNCGRVAIGAVFLAQILAHIAYGGHSMFGKPDMDIYLYVLSRTGWLQLLLLGGWASGDAARRFLHPLWDRLRGRLHRPDHGHIGRGG